VTEIAHNPSQQEMKRAEMLRVIPVDEFITKYEVTNPDVVEILHDYPVLVNLLGKVSSQPCGVEMGQAGKKRPYWVVEEGSGMFGLSEPEDALKWKGIFNHILGSARHVYYLATKLAHASPSQKEALRVLGYDVSDLSSLDPDLLRDHKLIDHAGRRQSDEFHWYGLRGSAHPSSNSEQNTVSLLQKNGMNSYFVDLMREEDHTYLTDVGKNGRIPSIVYNILTYGDWTYGQCPMELSERFKDLRKSKRITTVSPDKLERIGTNFESDLKEVFGGQIIDDMKHAKPYDWEIQIRNAYASSASLKAEDVFPSESISMDIV